MSSYFSLAPYYDSLTEDVVYNDFADYYEKLFAMRNTKVETILDLACGTGTLTYILAKRGYELIGVDASEEMLAVAAEKEFDENVPVRPMWLNQNMQELDLYGTVDAAVCSLDGINYVCEEDLDEVFSRLRLFVRPGGLFVFDVNSVYKLKNLDGQVFIDENEDVFCVWRTEFDEEENACYYGMDIFARIECEDDEDDLWERQFEEHIEYAHETEMLISKLEAHGFGNFSVFGELNTDAPKADEQRIFIVAERL